MNGNSLSILIKTLLEKSESNIKSQLSDIQSIVDKNKISIPITFDESSFSGLQEQLKQISSFAGNGKVGISLDTAGIQGQLDLLSSKSEKSLSRMFKDIGVEDQQTIQKLISMAEDYKKAWSDWDKEHIKSAMLDTLYESTKNVTVGANETTEAYKELVAYLRANPVKIESFGGKEDFTAMKKEIGYDKINLSRGQSADDWLQTVRGLNDEGGLIASLLGDVEHSEDLFQRLHGIIVSGKNKVNQTLQEQYGESGLREMKEGQLDYIIESFDSLERKAQTTGEAVKQSFQTTIDASQELVDVQKQLAQGNDFKVADMTWSGEQDGMPDKIMVDYVNVANEAIRATATLNDETEEYVVTQTRLRENQEQQKKTLDSLEASQKKYLETVSRINELAQNDQTRPIQDEGNLESIKSKAAEVATEINKIYTLAGDESRGLFKSEVTDIDILVQRHKDFVKQLQIQEYAATKLRTQSVDEVMEREPGSLIKLENKMKSAGVATDELNSRLENLREMIGSVTTKDEFVDYTVQKENLKALIDAEISTTKLANSVENLKTKYEEQVRVLREKNTELLKENPDLDNQLKEFENGLKSIENTSVSGKLNNEFITIKNGIKEVDQQAKQTERQLKRLGTPTGVSISGIIDNNSILSAVHSMEDLNKATLKNVSSFRANGEEYTRVVARVQQANGAFKDTVFTVNNATGEMNKLKDTMNQTGDTIVGLVTKVGRWLLATTLIHQPMRQLQNAVRDIVSIDRDLTELSKVVDISRSEFQQLSIEALNTASSMGRTASSVLTAYESFAKAGFSDYKGMAELALTTEVAGDMTAELASQYLVASNAAFNFNGDLEKMTLLIDSQNQVSNRHAITMEFLANATKQVGNVMTMAGESTQTMTALMTTAGVATQKSGNEIGRSLRTATLRLQQVKQNFDELEIDIDGDVVNTAALSNASKALEQLGFQTISVGEDGKETFATLSQTLLFLADAVDKGTISTTELNKVIDALGGKHHSETLLSIVNNVEEYNLAMSNFENASGSAFAEAEKVANSFEGRVNALKNTFTSFIASITDISGGATQAIGIFTAVLDPLLKGVAFLINNPLGQVVVHVTALTTALKLLNKANVFEKATSGFTGLLRLKIPSLVQKVFRYVGTTIMGKANGCLRPVNYQPMSKLVSRMENMLWKG